jgi:cullin 3
MICLHRGNKRLYDLVAEKMKTCIPTLCHFVSGSDEHLLDNILALWRTGREAMRCLRDVFLYLDTSYVLLEKKTSLYDEELRIFRDTIFFEDSLAERTVERIILEVRAARNGEWQVNHGRMEEILQMMMELGPEDVFEKFFEAKYIEETSEYYRHVTTTSVDELSTPEYVRMARRRLFDEERLCDATMKRATKNKIMNVVKEELLKSRLDDLLRKENSGLWAQLRDKDTENLRTMYEVLGELEANGGHTPMEQELCRYFKHEGMQIMENETFRKDFHVLVTEMISLRRLADFFLDNCFFKKPSVLDEKTQDRLFSESIARAFSFVLNKEKGFFVEALALYVDSIMKRASSDLTDESQEQEFGLIIKLYRHLDSKDVFEEFYKRHLSRRLLGGKSESEILERAFISHLRYECGYAFTRKLEFMFRDMQLSTDIMNDFATGEPMVANRIQVRVLTSGSWPVTHSSKCLVPRQLQSASESFSHFYSKRFRGRKLTWQYSMGSGELLFESRGRTYHMNVTTFQMCVLALFNRFENVTFQQMLDETGIEEKELKRNVIGLMLDRKEKRVTKLLVKKGSAGKQLLPTDSLAVNVSFFSAHPKVSFGPVMLKEAPAEKEVTLMKVNTQRQFEVDACIVRVLKSKKAMAHQQLIMSVITQLKKRFVPKPMVIKKRIETLISKDYIRRNKDDAQVYEYIS